MRVDCALVTLNRERRSHWTSRADATSAVRQLTMIRARNEELPRLGRVGVTFQPVMVRRRGPLADTGAHMPTLKAAVDGLRDAGVLVDDTGRYIPALTFLAPVRGEVEGFVLTLIEEDNDEGERE